MCKILIPLLCHEPARSLCGGRGDPVFQKSLAAAANGGKKGADGVTEEGGSLRPPSLPLTLSAVEPNFENVKRQKTDRGHEIAILATFVRPRDQLLSEPNTVGIMALYDSMSYFGNCHFSLLL